MRWQSLKSVDSLIQIGCKHVYLRLLTLFPFEECEVVRRSIMVLSKCLEIGKLQERCSRGAGHLLCLFFQGVNDICFVSHTSYTMSGQCLAVGHTPLLISCKSVQLVPAWVEEPVSPEGNLLVVVSRTIHPFSRNW